MSLGWIGGMLLAICGLPETIKTVKNGRCDLSSGFLLLWGSGEVFTLISVCYDAPFGYLLLNYGLNIVFIGVMCYYKVKEFYYEHFCI
jgi:hypothetical protein